MAVLEGPDGWTVAAGFAADVGIVREGRSEVEAFVGGAAPAVAEFPNENEVDGFAALVDFDVADESVTEACGGIPEGGMLVCPRANVTVFFSGMTGASLLTFSLSFVIAAASRSCFSHLEYDRDGLSLGLSGAVGMTGVKMVEIRRTSALCDGLNGLAREFPLATTDLTRTCCLRISFVAVEDHKRFFPLDGESCRQH